LTSEIGCDDYSRTLEHLELENNGGMNSELTYRRQGLTVPVAIGVVKVSQPLMVK